MIFLEEIPKLPSAKQSLLWPIIATRGEYKTVYADITAAVVVVVVVVVAAPVTAAVDEAAFKSSSEEFLCHH